MKMHWLALLTITLAISACTSRATQEPSDAPSLPGTWALTSFGQAGSLTPVVAGSRAELTFTEGGTVEGNSGCNGFNGDYTVDGDRITFGQIVSTAMACEEPLMRQEELVYRVLTDSTAFQIDGKTLTITNDDMMLMLTRSTQSTAEPPALLTGAWKLTSYGTSDVMTSALADVDAGLTFSQDGTVTGTSGCNQFGGGYTAEGDKITFREIISTLKLCDSPLMGQEEAMYQVLTETATYQIEGSTLTITNNDRVLVLRR